MQKLTLFKLINDQLEFVGYFDSQEMLADYFTQIGKMIETEGRTNLRGEYLALPTLYFELKPTQPNNDSKGKS